MEIPKSPATIVVNVEGVLRVDDSPSNGAIRMLNKLHSTGNHIVLISTSRKAQAFVDIPHWLHDNEVCWDTLRFHNLNEPDGDVEFFIHCIKELWADGFDIFLGIVSSIELKHALEDIGISCVAVEN